MRSCAAHRPTLSMTSLVIGLACSSFSDVFDADHFIASLSSDIRIVKELPPELRDEEPTAIEPKSWSTVRPTSGDWRPRSLDHLMPIITQDWRPADFLWVD